MRIPIKATAREPINRPDTYQRLPLSKHNLTCDQQPVHTLRQKRTYRRVTLAAVAALSLSAPEYLSIQPPKLFITGRYRDSAVLDGIQHMTAIANKA